ncbi:MAG: hypothetical protein KJZ93_04610 [Caldilineaceae bacterium]|nr:hypothetical protein [Caldilineaceae bacterium]
MSDETKSEGAQANPTGAAEEPKLERDLTEELNRLGKSFVDAAKVAWESDQRRQLQADLKVGLNRLAEGLEDGFKKVSESEETKKLVDQAEDVAEAVTERVRNSEVAQEIGQGLLKGLRSLGAQLDKLAAEFQTAKSEDAPAQATGEQPQEVPVEKKPPANG